MNKFKPNASKETIKKYNHLLIATIIGIIITLFYENGYIILLALFISFYIDYKVSKISLNSYLENEKIKAAKS